MKAGTDRATPTELYSAESWERAKEISSLIGEVPSSFTSTVHFLRKDIEAGQGTVSPGTKFCLGRLLKSDVFRSPIYYGGLTFFENLLPNYNTLNSDAFCKIYGVDGLCTAIALFYLHKRIEQGCDKDEWQKLSASLLLESEVGGHFGIALPTVGFPAGLLVGGIRSLGIAMFLGIDKKGYVNYRRSLKGKNNYDMQQEMNIWGCTHAQTGSILLQFLGMGVGVSNAITLGLNPEIRILEELPEEAIRVNVASFWIDSLLKTGKVPDITHLGKYYPLKSDLDRLLASVDSLRKNGSTHKWLQRSKNDVSPETTPQLCSPLDRGKAAQNGKAAEPPPPADIPDELLKDLSDEEIAKFEGEQA